MRLHTCSLSPHLCSWRAIHPRPARNLLRTVRLNLPLNSGTKSRPGSSAFVTFPAGSLGPAISGGPRPQARPATPPGTHRRSALGSSPEDYTTALYVAAHFKAAGLQTEIVPYSVLLNKPLTVQVEAFDASGLRILNGPTPEHVTPTADPAVDRLQSDPRVLPAFNDSSPAADITAPVVYANYGRLADFKRLAELGVSVKDKIVLVRYGGPYRGVKVYVAQQPKASSSTPTQPTTRTAHSQSIPLAPTAPTPPSNAAQCSFCQSTPEIPPPPVSPPSHRFPPPNASLPTSFNTTCPAFPPAPFPPRTPPPSSARSAVPMPGRLARGARLSLPPGRRDRHRPPAPHPRYPPAHHLGRHRENSRCHRPTPSCRRWQSPRRLGLRRSRSIQRHRRHA